MPRAPGSGGRAKQRSCSTSRILSCIPSHVSIGYAHSLGRTGRATAANEDVSIATPRITKALVSGISFVHLPLCSASQTQSSLKACTEMVQMGLTAVPNWLSIFPQFINHSAR